MKQILMSLILLTITGCTTHYPNQNVTGMMFPTIQGTTLESEQVDIPDFTDNQVSVFLVGYKQDTQFDIDRWLIGLEMTSIPVSVYELPIIAGMFPRMFSTQIDEGMRRGIPKELWGGVITVYKQGEEIQAFTGNENPNNARVLLLDQTGRITFFYDRGFSVDALNKLHAALKTLNINEEI